MTLCPSTSFDIIAQKFFTTVFSVLENFQMKFVPMHKISYADLNLKGASNQISIPTVAMFCVQAVDLCLFVPCSCVL